MTARPKLDQTYADLAAAVDAARAADPLIGEAEAHAAGSRTIEERAQHVAFAADRLASALPALPVEDWFELLWAGLAGRSARIGTVPGLAGRILWAVRDEADAGGGRSW